MLASWFDLKSGHDCPLCTPRPAVNEFTYFVGKLSVSSLYLARNQTYRGTCAVVYDLKHATRLSDLDRDAWLYFSDDIRHAECAVTAAFRPDHINIEILGNTVPHLHAGIIPRYQTDPRWGQPVWMTSRSDMPIQYASDTECHSMVELLKNYLVQGSIA